MSDVNKSIPIKNTLAKMRGQKVAVWKDSIQNVFEFIKTKTFVYTDGLNL